jgi:hypothetical protein
MSEQAASGESKNAVETISWVAFLESQPPNQLRNVSLMASHVDNHAKRQLRVPSIRLHCDSEGCDGLHFFDSTQSGIWLTPNESQCFFLMYRCRHCRVTSKVYAVRVFHSMGDDGQASKLGELPPFGPHIPTKMFSLLGEDQELFHKGSRAESQGMGIGAFAYYRRVVENQKNRLIDEIIKVCKKLNVDQSIIAKAEKARSETQFTKALEILKDAMPDVLRIDGHNPLALLHTALSDGLHEQSDEECLLRAQSIRLVLAELSGRIVQVLKEHTELKQAVSKLLQVKSQKPTERPISNATKENQ